MKVYNEINKFMKEFKQNLEVTIEEAEVVYIKPLSLLYYSLRKLLKDNKVIKEDSSLEQKKITKIVGSIIKV